MNNMEHMHNVLRAAVGLVVALPVTMAIAQFPDAHNPPPAGWTGPVFKLKQDYPRALPPMGTRPWGDANFKTQPIEYMKAVLGYALEGNKEADFVVQNNSVRGWYHAPWMHPGVAGREFIRGLTREKSSRPRELHQNQTSTFDNWAVSVYNPRGAYTIGQVWKDPNSPDPSVAKFPIGTVGIKLVFTEATVAEVPYLAGSVEWQADIKRAGGSGARPTLRLLQVDLAVRDSGANSTTGWVFATFVYDGNAPGATPWDRLVPIGLMWGNDPSRMCTTLPLRETKINADLKIPLHIGFERRLNGPIDHPRSSCLSCHSTAQIQPDLSRASRDAMPPANASAAALKQYFRNLKSGVPFDAGAIALDYSLQLQNGLANWAQANPDGPQGASRPGVESTIPLRKRLDASRGVKVTPIGRGE